MPNELDLCAGYNVAYLGQKVDANSCLVCVVERVIHEPSNQ
jgi:hypothetical protein